MQIERARKLAKRRSLDSLEIYHVIEFDSEDSRTIGVISESNTYNDEFEAFNSVILESYFEGKET